jgi:hypothetical protein
MQDQRNDRKYQQQMNQAAGNVESLLQKTKFFPGRE